MERFSSIYPFTTENIKGYMDDLDLNNKKIITVTGSSDHIINAVLKGCTDITTFDINELTKYYMDLKLSAIKELSYKEFLDFLLYDTDKTLDYNTIKKLDMNNDSKTFWLNKLAEYDNDGLKLKYSNLFNLKYFDIQNKIDCNLYIDEKNYAIIKERIKLVKIRFINTSLKNLELNEKYDYMFLSNISDYIDTFYDKEFLNNYKELIFKLLDKVKTIYFAYIYDVESKEKRSVIDNIENVKKVFENIKIVKFKSALIGVDNNKMDAVLIKEE